MSPYHRRGLALWLLKMVWRVDPTLALKVEVDKPDVVMMTAQAARQAAAAYQQAAARIARNN